MKKKEKVEESDWSEGEGEGGEEEGGEDEVEVVEKVVVEKRKIMQGNAGMVQRYLLEQNRPHSAISIAQKFNKEFGRGQVRLFIYFLLVFVSHFFLLCSLFSLLFVFAFAYVLIFFYFDILLLLRIR